MRRLLVIIPLLSACVYNDPDATLRAQLQPFVGQPLTAYLAATGETPASAYDTDDGLRHFVFPRSGVSTVPAQDYGLFATPSMVTTQTCNRTVSARRDGKTHTPDAYRIVSINAANGC